MKTRLLIITTLALVPLIAPNVSPAYGQYLGDKIPPDTMINDKTGEYVFPPSYVEFYYSNSAFTKFPVIAGSYHYDVPYMITNGTVSKMKMDCSNVELVLDMKPSGDKGWLTLALPRQLIDSKMGSHEDDGFIVLVNSNEVHRSDISSEKLRILIIPISNDTFHINVIGVNYPEHVGENACNEKSEHPFSYLLSPLKQIKNGVEPYMVKCNDGLTLLLKPTEFTKPACVTDETFENLSHRGWAVVPDDYQDW